MGRIVNRSELAEAFGVALSTIDLWVQQGMPCLARPERRGGSGYKIDLAGVLEWHRERERQSALGEIADVDEKQAKRRKIAAQAALMELDLAVRQGRFVAIADEARAWSAMIATARAKLLAIGPRLGPIVAVNSNPAECRTLVDEAIYEALRELSGFDVGPEQPPESARKPEGGDTGGGPAVGPASKADRKRVGRQKPPAKRRKLR